MAKRSSGSPVASSLFLPSQGNLKPARFFRGRRSGHHVDGAGARLPGNQHGLREEPTRVHSPVHERGPHHDLSSDGPVCKPRGWHPRLQWCAHQRGRRGRGGDGRHGGNPCDLHALKRYVRSRGHVGGRGLGARYKHLTSFFSLGVGYRSFNHSFLVQ